MEVDASEVVAFEVVVELDGVIVELDDIVFELDDIVVEQDDEVVELVVADELDMLGLKPSVPNPSVNSDEADVLTSMDSDKQTSSSFSGNESTDK